MCYLYRKTGPSTSRNLATSTALLFVGTVGDSGVVAAPAST